MATRAIERFSSIAEISDFFPGAAGIGVVGGIPYLNADGAPRPLGGGQVDGNVLVVDPASATASNGVFSTIQAAVDAAVKGTTILIARKVGGYDETVTIGRTDADGVARSNITLRGCGGRGSVFIEPSTEDADGLVVHADDVTIVNLGCAGEDETSAAGLTVTGARFRAYGCKLEGGLNQLLLGPGTDAQITAGTRGDGADALFEDCEFAWGTNGVMLQASDYGAVTQARFRACKFHNLTAAAFEESDGTGGSASVHFRNLEITDCVFDDLEGGTAPTKFISLNDDNGNDGIVSGCRFPTAIDGGKNLVSTALHWVCNQHTGGISTAQPS